MLRFVRVVTFRNGKRVAEFEQEREDGKKRKIRLNEDDTKDRLDILRVFQATPDSVEYSRDLARRLDEIPELEKALEAL